MSSPCARVLREHEPEADASVVRVRRNSVAPGHLDETKLVFCASCGPLIAQRRHLGWNINRGSGSEAIELSVSIEHNFSRLLLWQANPTPDSQRSDPQIGYCLQADAILPTQLVNPDSQRHAESVQTSAQGRH
jgi:hypothetical protein